MRAFCYLKFVVGVLLFSSCATLFNTERTSVYLKKPSNLKIDSVTNALLIKTNHFVSKRGPDTLRVYLSADSSHYTMLVPSKKSPVYWENFLNLGLGFFVDRNSLKRFSYPKTLYVEEEQGAYIYGNAPLLKKGTFFIAPGFPYFNSFYIKTDRNYKGSFGFIGLSLGLDYVFKTNRYLHLSLSQAQDFPVPVPAPFHYAQEYYRLSIQYMSLRYHRCYGRLDIGYGLGFSHSYYFGRVMGADSLFINHTSENIGLGGSLALRYLGNRFHSVGVIYQPSVIGFYPANFGYQHFLTIEFIFRIKCFRPKKGKKITPVNMTRVTSRC